MLPKKVIDGIAPSGVVIAKLFPTESTNLILETRENVLVLIEGFDGKAIPFLAGPHLEIVVGSPEEKGPASIPLVVFPHGDRKLEEHGMTRLPLAQVSLEGGNDDLFEKRVEHVHP